jgi:L-malate glycosyltransferase
MKKRVFFLTGDWVALHRLMYGESSVPEGMPSVYLPWLRYQSRGYEVHVLYLENYPNTLEFMRAVNFQGVQIHRVRRPTFFQWLNRNSIFRFRFPMDIIVLYRAACKLAQQKGPPDVVYTLQPWFGPATWILGKKYKAVVVSRIYGTWLYYDWFQSVDWRRRIACIPHFAMMKVPHDLMVISNDGTEGDRLADFLRIPRKRVHMRINGVNKEWQCDPLRGEKLRKQLDIDEGEFVLLCLSRLSSWKRQDRVISAMPEIVKHIHNARLVLVGDGLMREKLAQHAASLGVEKKVLFTGMIPHEHVRDYMGIADIFLQTNDLSCLGNSLLEAVICGCAIITWDVGTTRDLIKDGLNGILLPNADPQTISEAVIDLYRDPEKREMLANGARKYAIEHLEDWDQRLDWEINEVEALLSVHKK